MKSRMNLLLILLSWVGIGSGVFFFCSRAQHTQADTFVTKENELHTLSFMISRSGSEANHIIRLRSLLSNSDNLFRQEEEKKLVAQMMVWPTLLCLNQSKTVNGPAYDDLLKQYPFNSTVRRNLMFNAEVAIRSIADFFDLVEKPQEMSEGDWHMIKEAVSELKATGK